MASRALLLVYWSRDTDTLTWSRRNVILTSKSRCLIQRSLLSSNNLKRGRAHFSTMDVQSGSPTSVCLIVHIAVTLNVTAEEARHRVNTQAVTELGTGLVAREPELLFTRQQIAWRVPVVLSLPGLGDLGQVGTINVDAITGDLGLDDAVRESIARHAHWLYAGATLPAM